MVKRKRKLAPQLRRRLLCVARRWLDGERDCDIVGEIEKAGLLPDNPQEQVVILAAGGQGVAVAMDTDGDWDAWVARII